MIFTTKYNVRILFVFIILISSCQADRSERIIKEQNIRIVGDIKDDTIYNGAIKIYSLKTKKLLAEKNFRNNILNGPFKMYYIEGGLSLFANFENDQLNGYRYLYDKSGWLEQKDFHFHGIRVGPVLEYNSGALTQYYFNSFDNNKLVDIIYDSLSHETLLNHQKSFFFIQKRTFDEFINDDQTLSEKCEYFIYLPNPPKFRFSYSLVVINNNYEVVQDIRKLKNADMPWVVFDLEKDITKKVNRNYAVELEIYDSINSKNYWLYKMLKD